MEPQKTAMPGNQEVPNDQDLIYDEKDGKLQISLSDLLAVTSGLGEDGEPAAAGMLLITEIQEGKEQARTVENVVMKNAVFQIYWHGGCSVVTCDFPQNAAMEYARSVETCCNWLKDIHNPDYDNYMFTLLLTPYILQNYMQLIFTQLVYCSWQNMDNFFRLTLAFNNNDNASTVLVEDETDYEMIMASIDAELRRQEEELDAELEDIKEEKKQIQNDQFLKPLMNDALDGLSNNIRRKSEDKNEDDDDYDDSPLRVQKEFSGLRVEQNDENDKKNK